jgi:transcriptional regulator with XRE-family HTH domain
MSKRNKIIIRTPESEALITLRKKSELSIRKLADLMGISPSKVHQMESGRGNIGEDYIANFLRATNYCWPDWNEKIGGNDSSQPLREECHGIIDTLSVSRLKKALDALTRLQVAVSFASSMLCQIEQLFWL